MALWAGIAAPRPAEAGPRWSCRGRAEALRRALAGSPSAEVLAEATRLASADRACGALMAATSEALLQSNPQTAALIATLAVGRWPEQHSLGPLAVDATLRAGQVAQARRVLNDLQRADPRGRHTRASAVWVALAEGGLSEALRQADALPADHPAAVCAYATAERAADPRVPMAGRCDGAPLTASAPKRPATAPRSRPDRGVAPRAPPAAGGWEGALAEAHALRRRGEKTAARDVLHSVQRLIPNDPGLQLLAIRWGPSAEAAAALQALLNAPMPAPSDRPTCATDAALGAVMGRSAVDLAQLHLKAGDEAAARATLDEARRRFGPSPALHNLERRLRPTTPIEPPPG